MHGVLQVFGDSEVALRLPSAVAGICTIPLLGLLTEEITKSRTTAAIAALLLAVNPLHLWYSQEARPYAVLLLFGSPRQGTFHSPPRPLTGLEPGYAQLTYVTGFSFGPGPRDLQNLGVIAALSLHSVQTALAGAVLLGALVISAAKYRATMACFFSLLALTLAGVLVLSALSGKAYNVRYTLPALVGFLGIVSIAVRALSPGARALSLAGFLSVALWADLQWFRSARYWKEDSRAAVAWLRTHAAPGATVGIAPAYGVRPLRCYARKAGADLHFVPRRFRGRRRGRYFGRRPAAHPSAPRPELAAASGRLRC